MTQPLSVWRWAVGGIFLSSALAVGVWGLSTSDVRADREHHADQYRNADDHDDDYNKELRRKQRATANVLYAEECGSCHLAYPAKLLQTESWQALLSGLDNHFGDNAQLAPLELNQIHDYLVLYAADNNSYRNRLYSNRFNPSTPLLRITEQPFFIKEHDEIPREFVTDNQQVGSFSQCDSCHRDAVKGNFDEDQVNIPGYGRWD